MVEALQNAGTVAPLAADAAGKRVLALIRHGSYHQPFDVPSAHLPYALTDQGRDQAKAAARAVADYARRNSLEIDLSVDCSRLRRAWETASVIASELSFVFGRVFSTCEFDALSERSLGAAANLSVAAIEAVLRDDPRFGPPPPEWKRSGDYRLPLPGAETLLEAGSRVAKHIRRRATDLGASQLKLLVGHGGAFRHAAQHLGLLDPTRVASLSMFHCTPLYFEIQPLPGEPCRLIHLDGAWKKRSEDAPWD